MWVFWHNSIKIPALWREFRVTFVVNIPTESVSSHIHFFYWHFSRSFIYRYTSTYLQTRRNMCAYVYMWKYLVLVIMRIYDVSFKLTKWAINFDDFNCNKN